MRLAINSPEVRAAVRRAVIEVTKADPPSADELEQLIDELIPEFYADLKWIKSLEAELNQIEL